MQNQNDQIEMGKLSRAKTDIENAKRYAGQLQALITYARTDHVGMLQGNGELTRYANFLVSRVWEGLANASQHLESAHVPDELPF